MPLANVRGVNINYKVLGNHGPWVALSPGGRRDISGIELTRRRSGQNRSPRRRLRPAQLRRFRCRHRWRGFGIRDLGR